MGIDTGSVQPPYHIQSVGNQYELRSVGTLRSWIVRLLRGEYGSSGGSLGRLKEVATTLSKEGSQDSIVRLRSIVRSLTGMLEKCPPQQKQLVQDTLAAVQGLLAVKGEDPIAPKTPEEKLAIAKSIIERAQAGKEAAHWPTSFLQGNPSPLIECFQEYIKQQPPITKENLAQVIQAMYESGEDYREALLEALRRNTRENDPQEPKNTIVEAVKIFAPQLLAPCLKALKDPKSKDFGVLLLRAHQGIELVRATGLPWESLEEAVPVLQNFFQRMFRVGLKFSTTVSLPPRRFICQVSTEVPEVREWATSSPSMPLTNTFGRMTAIEIGEVRQEAHALAGAEEQDAQLANAYYYNQALKEYLEKEGVANAADVANQLMLRCTIDARSDYVLTTLGNVLLYPPKPSEPVLFRVDVSEFDDHPVIEPTRPTVRFFVEKETGKCIIERACPMQLGSEYAWRVTRAEFDPKKIGDRWTETVTTKPYAKALADEVQRRVVEEGKTTDHAIREITEALKLQINDEPKRNKMLEDLCSAVGSEIPKLAIAKSIITQARLGKPEIPREAAYFEGDPSLLTQCFQEYLAQPNLTSEDLARDIEAMMMHSNDGWDAMLQALTELTGKEADPQLRERIQSAASAVISRMFPRCAKVMERRDGADVGDALRIMYRLHELLNQTNIPSPTSDEPYKLADPSLGAFFDNFFQGYKFSCTLHLPGSHLLRPQPPLAGVDKEIQTWASSCPSTSIISTYRRITRIQIGEEKVERGSDFTGDAQRALTQTYRYNQALVTYLKNQGFSQLKAQEMADAMMLRSSGDLTMNNFFSSLGIIINASQVEQITFREGERPVQFGQAQVSFSVERGNCVVTRYFPVVRDYPDGEKPRQLVWVESRVVLNPNEVGYTWTEELTTKPYGVALADEVRRRMADPENPQPKKQAMASVTKELEDTIYGKLDRNKLPAQLVDAVQKLTKQMKKAL